jgi:hypothetical protein
MQEWFEYFAEKHLLARKNKINNKISECRSQVGQMTFGQM